MSPTAFITASLAANIPVSEAGGDGREKQ